MGQTVKSPEKAPKKAVKFIEEAELKRRPLIQRILPCGVDSAFEKTRKVAVIISFLTTVTLCVGVIPKKLDKKITSDGAANPPVVVGDVTTPPYQKEISGTFPPISDNLSINSSNSEKPKLEPLEEYVDSYNANSDFVGQVKVADTKINYGVYQTTDNSYYINHSPSKASSILGAVFADYKTKFFEDKDGNFDPTAKPDNIIAYAHNNGSGISFGRLQQYRPGGGDGLSNEKFKEFYVKNPTITFDTLYEKAEYKVFAAMLVDTDINDPLTYEYFRLTNFPDSATFYSYIANALDRSMFYTDTDLKYGDEILTLSTCSNNPFQVHVYETRFVVFARKLRPNESAETSADNVTINSNPLRFKLWYNWKGGSAEDWERSWDLNLVEGFAEYIKQNGDVSHSYVG